MSNFSSPSSPELAGPTTSGALLFFLSTFLMALLYTGFLYFSLLEPSLVGVRDFFHICAVVELAIHP